MTAPLRRLRLAGPQADELAPGEAEHALRVLRLSVGDAFEALDGAGRAWQARIRSIERRGLRFELEQLLRTEPPPGQAGSPLPHIEVVAGAPRLGHAEELVQHLSQLGAARWTPLITQRSPPQARELEGPRRERLERIAGEAMKQSGRLWAVEIAPPTPLEAFTGSGSGRLRCSPRASTRICDFVSKHLQTDTWTVFFGPEGGFEPAEEEHLEALGATAVWLAPQILRIEVAVAAALAVIVNQTARWDRG